MKIGIIGAGGVARMHIQALYQISQKNTLYFFDTNISSAQELAGQSCQEAIGK